MEKTHIKVSQELRERLLSYKKKYNYTSFNQTLAYIFFYCERNKIDFDIEISEIRDDLIQIKYSVDYYLNEKRKDKRKIINELFKREIKYLTAISINSFENYKSEIYKDHILTADVKHFFEDFTIEELKFSNSNRIILNITEEEYDSFYNKIRISRYY